MPARCNSPLSGGNGYFSSRVINVLSGGGSINDGGFAPGEASGGGVVNPGISIASGSGLSLVSSNRLQYSGVISGAGGITTFATGTGSVNLLNASSYSGGTTISTGTLAIYNDSALGSGAVTINDGGTLANNDTVAHTLANAITLNGATAGETFTGSQNLTLSGTISSAAAVKVFKTGSSVLNLGVADNTGTLAASSSWTVQGGNYNSTTGLYDNVLAISSGLQLGSSNFNVLNLNAGTLLFTASSGAGYNSNRTINVLAGGGAINDGGFAPGEAGGGTGSVAPNIVISSGPGLNLVSSNKLQFSGVISGAGPLTLFGTGSGALTLLGTDAYSGGTTIKGGTLNVGNASALGSTTAPLSVTSGILNTGGFNISAGACRSRAVRSPVSTWAAPPCRRLRLRVSGTNYVGFTGATTAAPGTYNIISSTGGGMTGTFRISGAQDLTVPVSASGCQEWC